MEECHQVGWSVWLEETGDYPEERIGEIRESRGKIIYGLATPDKRLTSFDASEYILILIDAINSGEDPPEEKFSAAWWRLAYDRMDVGNRPVRYPDEHGIEVKRSVRLEPITKTD